MIIGPGCGKENEDSAFECRRCRAPLREEVPEEAPAEAAAGSVSSEVGTVCRRCEAFNEPGVRVCSACGYDLFAEALQQAAEEEAPADQTPPDGPPSLSDELAGLALSDQEAAEAGRASSTRAARALDRTPPPHARRPRPA